MIMSLFYSYASVMIKWVIGRRQKSTMTGLEHVNLIPKHTFIINNILTACRTFSGLKYTEKGTIISSAHTILLEKDT